MSLHQRRTHFFFSSLLASAIKRLLFQQKLLFAADADPYGDEAQVRVLVQEWKHAGASGAHMFPLAYRFDVAFLNPLQIAVSYGEPNENIVELLLSLPQCLHVQGKATKRAAFHEAAALYKFQPEAPGGKAYLQRLLDAGWQVNHRDIATNTTALAVVCDLDPSADEEEADFRRFMLRTAQFLTERGADPRLTAATGANSCLTLVIRNANNIPLLRHLLHVLKEDRAGLSATNAFGNTAMHYALYHSFDRSEHVEQLQLLLEAGLRVDAPPNRAGLTPLQCWAGYRSSRAEACAQMMKVTMQQIKQLIEPPKNRVARTGQYCCQRTEQMPDPHSPRSACAMLCSFLLKSSRIWHSLKPACCRSTATSSDRPVSPLSFRPSTTKPRT